MHERSSIHPLWAVLLTAVACVAAPVAAAHEPHEATPKASAVAETPRPASDHDRGVTEHALAAKAHEAHSPTSRDHRQPQGVPPLLAWGGRFHPALVHFPIALLCAAAMAEILLAVTGRRLYRDAVRFCVWGGVLGAVGAVVLGWLFGGFRTVDDEWVMTSHRWLGTGTAAWALLTLAACERVARNAAPRGSFRTALFVGAALVAATGFLGGSLVYGIDHYAW